ncbi:hypothetical protein FH972_023005 [Carpinus fangiana]|uniref:Aquaporin n=1 Tax=Carpinus fangiana TaxID=176857 RepID=A0A5N6KUF7_9ROSI|nr:hypothetical protein FH972_023005 [Carpinus fangiana]
MANNDLNRMETIDTAQGDVELGVTDVLAKHYSRHPVERRAISQRQLDFERARPRWLREMLAEATGVFFYVFPGIASIASFTLAAGNPETAPLTPVFGSLFQIGLAFAIGISFAIIVCAPTSGGHFNPAVTICLAVWQGFPWKKVPYFIFSQIFGSFMAGMMLMGMYHEQLSEFAARTTAAGEGTVFNGGPASVLVSFPNANQTNLGYLVLIEFFVCSFIIMVIWACIDPANPFVSPAQAPYTIGLVYATMVWGFADITISTNMARDLGCRLVAAIFYGREAFTYHNYSWIAILINIPASLFGVTYYELVMRDSLQKIGKGRAVHAEGEEALQRHITNSGLIKTLSNAKHQIEHVKTHDFSS